MEKPIRWGVLGAASFALKHMAPALHAAEGTELVALATRDIERARPCQAFCPGLKVHDNYDALLADPDVDAVYIPLPNTLHVPWSIKALNAGKHVLCEKPLAMQADDIDALIGLRDQTGLVVTEAYMIAHHPQWQRVKALLDKGYVGELMHVNGLFSFRNTDLDNIRNRAEMGGGGLSDIGVYTLGSARFATGQEPKILSARLTMENGVDVKAEIQGTLGAASLFTMVSTRMHPYQEMLFHGTEGYIKVRVPFNAGVAGEAQIEMRQSNGPVQIENWPQAAQYVEQVEAFGRAVQGEESILWTLEDARETRAVLDQVIALATNEQNPSTRPANRDESQ